MATPIDLATWVPADQWELFDMVTIPKGPLQLRIRTYRSLNRDLLEIRVAAEFWARNVSPNGAVDFERTPFALYFKSDLTKIVNVLVAERLVAEAGARGGGG